MINILSKSNLLTSLATLSAVQGAAYSPTLDPTNLNQLTAATTKALKNLIAYYRPNSTGVFDQTDTPWHESGMIWGMFMDYAQYTGDLQFSSVVTGALVNSSYTTAHDFLGGDKVPFNQTLIGRWNDDILWPTQAVVAGAEIFGPHSIMPGSGADWISLATKTYDQAGAQTDNKCGGGIYWSRDRGWKGGSYKAVITQLEFISVGARNYIQTKNESAFHQSKEILHWVHSSGLGNKRTGVLWDGVGVNDCSDFTTLLWSYTYGQLLGALAWMYKATGNQEYLDMTNSYFDYGARTFAAANTTGVIAEQCEADDSCNRDQKGFKAIYARNLAYLYRFTNNQTMKNSIKKIIMTSVNAMVERSCDTNWNCGGNWTKDAHPVKYVRSQHVSAALLVAAVGIQSNPRGSQLSVAPSSSLSN